MANGNLTLNVTVRVRWTLWARLLAWWQIRRMINRGDEFTYDLVNAQGVMDPVRLRCWLLREGYERDLKRDVWWKPERKQ